MDEIIIREMKPEEFDTLREWNYKMCVTELSMNNENDLNFTESALRIDKMFLETLNDSFNKLRVADVSGFLSGFVLYGPNREFFTFKRRMFVYAIYVDEAFRNKNVGKKLMDYVETEARSNGLDRVWLTVSENNEAVSFYEKLNFTNDRRTMSKKING